MLHITADRQPSCYADKNKPMVVLAHVTKTILFITADVVSTLHLHFNNSDSYDSYCTS